MNKSPNKEEVVTSDNDINHGDDHSKERVFDEGEHTSVHAEEGLSREKEHVQSHRAQTTDSNDVITVTESTLMRRQLSYAIAKLFNNDDIILKAQGHSIGKAVRMAEIIKARVEFLHQVTEFERKIHLSY